MDQNDTKQFSWMSWGGILAPWVPVFIAQFFVPLSLTTGAVLFSVLFYKAVATAAFEVPIVQAATEHGEPGRSLRESVTKGGLPRARKIGIATRVVSFLLITLAN